MRHLLGRVVDGEGAVQVERRTVEIAEVECLRVVDRATRVHAPDGRLPVIPRVEVAAHEIDGLRVQQPEPGAELVHVVLPRGVRDLEHQLGVVNDPGDDLDPVPEREVAVRRPARQLDRARRASHDVPRDLRVHALLEAARKLVTVEVVEVDRGVTRHFEGADRGVRADVRAHVSTPSGLRLSGGPQAHPTRSSAVVPGSSSFTISIPRA